MIETQYTPDNERQYTDEGSRLLVVGLFKQAWFDLRRGVSLRLDALAFVFGPYAAYLADLANSRDIEWYRERFLETLADLGYPAPVPCPRCRTGFILEPDRAETCPECIKDLTPVYCAWCGSHMKGPETDDPAQISHSICPACEREQGRAVEELKKRN